MQVTQAIILTAMTHFFAIISPAWCLLADRDSQKGHEQAVLVAQTTAGAAIDFCSKRFLLSW